MIRRNGLQNKIHILCDYNCSLAKVSSAIKAIIPLWFIFDIHFYLWFQFCFPFLLHSFILGKPMQFSLWRLLIAFLWYICSSGLCLVSREHYSNGSFMLVRGVFFFVLSSGHLLYKALNNIFDFNYNCISGHEPSTCGLC